MNRQIHEILDFVVTALIFIALDFSMCVIYCLSTAESSVYSESRAIFDYFINISHESRLSFDDKTTHITLVNKANVDSNALGQSN